MSITRYNNSMQSAPSFQLPFEEEWLVFWGGDTKELNHHHDSIAQCYAFDFVLIDENGKFYASDDSSNENYYSFGKDVLAPEAGEVIEASDGVRDNEPGDTNPYSLIGNYVLIKHGEGLFSLLAHLKNGSICVNAGDRVTVGQKIGQCGNSGNSSSAHLHYQLQSSDVFSRFTKNYGQEDVAKGLKVSFTNIKVRRDGETEVKDYYSPIKNDYVSNKK